MLLVGVYKLAQTLTDSRRVAGVAALLYATAPAFGSHTLMVSYESVGMSLAVWAVVFTVWAAIRPERRLLTVAIACILVATTGVTHPLSSAFLLLFLSLLVVASLVRTGSHAASSERRPVVFGSVLCFAAAFDIVWAAWQQWNPLPYLLPHDAVDNMLSVFDPGNFLGRVPFQASGLPIYEHAAGFVAQLIVTALAVAGFRYGQTTYFRQWPQVRWLLAAFYAFYAFTFIGVFVAGQDEWVHRPWPYVYVGLSVLSAVGLVRLLEMSERADLAAWSIRVVGLALRRVTVLSILVIVVLLIGNTAASSPNQDRFPGRWIAGADSRSGTTEMLEATQWFRKQAGANAQILSDKDTANNFFVYADAVPVADVAAWELTETEAPVTSVTLIRMAEMNVQYVVVDERISTSVSLRGFWYGTADPLARRQTTPFPGAAVNKLAAVPWASVVYQDTNLRIYKINHSALLAAAVLR
jgi:hypothetical protein